MDWIFTTATHVPEIILSAILIYVVLVIYTRLAGLRSFSKMSSFDFAITVAFGSILASTVITQEPPVFQASIALGTLFALQALVSYARSRHFPLADAVDNDPIVLMTRKGFVERNLQKTRVTKNDIRSKLREANVIDVSELKAVILEPTGDISVLHGDSDTKVDGRIIKNVRDSELLTHD